MADLRKEVASLRAAKLSAEASAEELQVANDNLQLDLNTTQIMLQRAQQAEQDVDHYQEELQDLAKEEDELLQALALDNLGVQPEGMTLLAFLFALIMLQPQQSPGLGHQLPLSCPRPPFRRQVRGVPGSHPLQFASIADC